MEFEPLLQPGIHDITVNDLSNYFVSPFSDQEKRIQLIERFGYLFEKVEQIGISFEIWIDGSFVTKKEEPNDIDIAFFYDPIQVNSLPADKKNILIEVSDNSLSKYRYYCDVYFIPNNDVALRSYWRGWFGYTRTEMPKGFARITV